MSARSARLSRVLALAVVGLLAAACSSTSNSNVVGDSGSAKTTVGFVMVGSTSDYGYNQAVYTASQQLAKDMPNVDVITADHVPENNAVTQTMQSMVNDGAKVIFATSYGYYSYAGVREGPPRCHRAASGWL